jgi:hypothetical protein
VGYVSLNPVPEDFWRVASRHTPFFSSSLSVKELDQIFLNSNAWQELRAAIQPGDKILPFAVNVDSLAMRLGYVVVRAGEPVGGVICVAS